MSSPFSTGRSSGRSFVFRTQTSPDVPPLAASTSSPVSAPETTRKVANQGAESTGPVAPASGDSVSAGVGAGKPAPGAAQPASRARPSSRAVRVVFFIVADLLFLSSDAAGSFLFPPGKIPLTF